MGVSEPAIMRGNNSEALEQLPQELGSASAPAIAEEYSEPRGGRFELPPNHRAKAVWGTIWVGIGFSASQVLRFGSNLVLTHLLLPDIFGLMALVNTLLMGLGLFSDVGIGPSIIQNKSGDEDRFLNTAWTIQVVRGLMLWLAAVLLAWPVAYFYAIPQLLWLVPAIGINSAIAGFNSTSLFTLARHLVRGPLVVLSLASYIAGMVVTILWVYLVRPDAWGFVLGSLVSSLITLVVSHLFLRGFRNRFCWDRSSLGELIHYGKWIFAATVFAFFTDQADRLVLGKLATLSFLGLYQVATQLALMPVGPIQAILGQIVMPIYSRHYHSSAGIRERIRRIHPLIAGLAGITATLLVVMGPTLIRCLYGTRFEEAGWMIRIMGLVAFIRILESAGTTTLMSMGQSKAPALGQGCKLTSMLVLMPAGYFFYGLVGLVSAFALTELVRYTIVVTALYRRGESVLGYDFTTLLCSLVIGSAVYLTCEHLVPATSHWITLAVGVGMILTLWSGVYLGFRARLWSWASGETGLVNIVP